MCLLVVNRESAQEKIALAPALRRRKKGGMDGKIGKFGKQIEDGKHSKQREGPFPFIFFFTVESKVNPPATILYFNLCSGLCWNSKLYPFPQSFSFYKNKSKNSCTSYVYNVYRWKHIFTTCVLERFFQDRHGVLEILHLRPGHRGRPLQDPGFVG